MTGLADRLGSCNANSPVLHKGTVYFVRGDVQAIRLPESAVETKKVPVLWKGKAKGDGGDKRAGNGGSWRY